MKTKSFIFLLTILSWIIFTGLCIVAGSFIVNISLAVFQPEWMAYTWKEADFTALYTFDRGYFFAQMSLITIATVLKAFLFFMILQLLNDKKMKIQRPFHQRVATLISKASFITLLISIFSYWGVKYSEWLTKKGIALPSVEQMELGGADVWMFMCVVLVVIAQVFKKGIELQNENDLTV